MYRTTKKQKRYWTNRKIDWKTSYFDTWNHPHRGMITTILKQMSFISLWEVGMGGGANLKRILEDLKGRPTQLNGCDVNQDAVDFCNQTFQNGQFHCESGDNLLMSDKSVDVLLSDMTLIYIQPKDIGRYLKEFRRVTRNYIVLCEFHSRSWWRRLIARMRGYHVYDYVRELEKQGYFNVSVYPIPVEMWPGTDHNTEFRSIIVARP